MIAFESSVMRMRHTKNSSRKVESERESPDTKVKSEEERVYNPGQRDEDGIQAAVEVALKKLNEADAKTKEDRDKVKADDDRRKSDIVKGLAKDLEKKIPTGSIAAEIVHQLVDAEKARHGKSKVSKRLIYKCLDRKYKRQWQKKHKDEDQDHPDPDQEESAPVHFRILVSRDSLSEQIARIDSPGIEWVWLSGVLDEKSSIVSNLKLERGDVLK